MPGGRMLMQHLDDKSIKGRKKDISIRQCCLSLWYFFSLRTNVIADFEPKSQSAVCLSFLEKDEYRRGILKDVLKNPLKFPERQGRFGKRGAPKLARGILLFGFKVLDKTDKQK
jgi:hypothetical protein